VLHGSCRKPHGDDENDCLAVGDSLLATNHNEVGKRPDLLLLTGDQIYADDVEATLLDVLREQAKTLMGRSETLPYYEKRNDSKEHILFLDGIKLGGRAAELKKCHSGFSSTEANNHLMSFGEFAAMYIYVFGNAKKWAKPKTWDEIKDKHAQLSGKDKGLEDIEANIKATNIFSAPESLLKVRRLLANIPTYMIFDDHDVTDDWNITGNWYDKVRSSPMGNRIVANALAAYWAFQGWGNDPDNFDSDMIEAITNHLNQTGPNPVVDGHYDLMTWKHRGWGFSIATDPPIIAMDSRTQRESEVAAYPPRLMDRYALDWLRVEWSKLKTCKKNCHDNANSITPDTWPILVATTPVFGFSPLEHFVRLVLWAIGYVESTRFVKPLEKFFDKEGCVTSLVINALDAEAWTVNLDGFTAFLDTVLHKMGIKQCVFLSGDVHYAFSINGSYSSGTSLFGAKQTLQCYQLTSSSLRNEPSKTQQKALDELESFEEGKTLWQHIRRQFRRLQVLRGWKITHELLEYAPLPINVKNKRIIEHCNLGQMRLNDKGKPTDHTLWWFDPNDAASLESVNYNLAATSRPPSLKQFFAAKWLLLKEGKICQCLLGREPGKWGGAICALFSNRMRQS
jgi:hypothetical protein